jgi:hypothetical protein
MAGTDRHPKYTAVGILLAAALAAWPPSASAQEPLPDDNAGTGQYIEPVPDAGGDRPAAPGGGGGGGGLDPDTRRGLPAGEEGRILERLATDAGSGAVPGAAGRDRADRKAGSGPADGDGPGARGGSSGDESSGVASAVTSAFTDSENGAGRILLALLVALPVAFAAVGLRRRRSS